MWTPRIGATGVTFTYYKENGYKFYHPSEYEKFKFEKLLFAVRSDIYFKTYGEKKQCLLFGLDLFDYVECYRPLKSCIYSEKINPEEIEYPCVLSIINKENGIKSIVRLTSHDWCYEGLYWYERCYNDYEDRIWKSDEIDLQKYDCYIPTSDELKVFSKHTCFEPYCDNAVNILTERITSNLSSIFGSQDLDDISEDIVLRKQLKDLSKQL